MYKQEIHTENVVSFILDALNDAMNMHDSKLNTVQ